MTDIAPAMPLVDEAAFAVGDVLGRSLSVFRRSFGKFALITGMVLLPDLIVSLTHPSVGTLSGGWSFVVTVLQVFADVAVLSAAFAQMNGRELGIWDAMREGGQQFRSALLATILQTVAVVLGLVLLVVPGLIALAMMYVALPVCVTERTGATASINRSAALTKGHRWKVFGVSLVANIGGGIILVLIVILTSQLGSPIGQTLVIYLSQVVYLAFTAVVSAVVYQTLRTAKEGPALQTLAEVFA